MVMLFHYNAHLRTCQRFPCPLFNAIILTCNSAIFNVPSLSFGAGRECAVCQSAFRILPTLKLGVSMIEVKDLTKAYGPRVALDNLTFDVQKGEILGFLGPNGAGKTTTMRILTGFMPPSSGKATVAGFDVFEQSMETRRRIGYLPESVPLYPEMTVWSYLNFMAELRGVKDREDHVEDVMEAVQITDRED